MSIPNLFRTILIGLVLFIPCGILAQGRVWGRITNAETGEALASAVVQISPQEPQAVTNPDGYFMFRDILVGRYTLRVSLAGFEEQTIVIDVIGRETEINFALKKKTNLPNATPNPSPSSEPKPVSSSVTYAVNYPYKMPKMDGTDIEQLLAGKFSGVEVSKISGALSAGILFQLRGGGTLTGQGSPLIFVDGIQLESQNIVTLGSSPTSSLLDLNPDDIAQIDVLKGASASALYGAQGANGVIKIRTKQGESSNRALTATYRYAMGFNQLARTYTSATAALPSRINNLFQDGNMGTHLLEVSGGSSGLRYFSSLNYHNENGATPNDALARYGYRLNVDITPRDRFNVSASAYYARTDVHLPLYEGETASLVGQLLQRPTPFAQVDSSALVNALRQEARNRFLGSVQAHYELFRGFSLNGILGYDAGTVRGDEFLPPNYAYPNIIKGRRTATDRKHLQGNYELNATYEFRPTSTILSRTLIGLQATSFNARTLQVQKDNFSTGLISQVGAGAIYTSANFETLTDRRTSGVFARQELSFNDRLFLGVGARQDAATAIGEGASSVIYPYANIGIRLDSFLPKSLAFNNLRLRFAYGESGALPNVTDGIDRLWLVTAGANGAAPTPVSIGTPEIEPEHVAEIEGRLDVEIAHAFGLTLAYYQSKVLQSILNLPQPISTGFASRRVNVGKAEGSGFEADLAYTPVRNRNTELSFHATFATSSNTVTDLATLPAQYDQSGIQVLQVGLPRYAFNAGVVVGAEYDATGQYVKPIVSTNVLADGSTFYERKADGNKGAIIPTSGSGGKIISASGASLYADGKISADGRQFLGISAPKYLVGGGVQMRLFRNLTLYASAEGRFGHLVRDNNLAARIDNGSNVLVNTLRMQLGLPCSTATAATNPCLFAVQPLSTGSAEYKAAAEKFALLETSVPANFLRSADFVRLREASVRYDLGQALLKEGSRVRSLQMAISAQNLWLWTTYTGADPELNHQGAGVSGTDAASIPLPRKIYATISIGF